MSGSTGAPVREATLIRVADAPRQRWRNGGGFTRELLVRPGAQAWQVRVSVAEIESDGPFSHFAGVRRWFAVLQGAGVVLTIDGRRHRVTLADAPLAFDGDAGTDCRLLGGPTRDLNLMLRGVGGGMQRAAAGARWSPPAGACGLFATTAGRCRVDDASLDVPADALLWFDHAPASLVFDPATPTADAAPGWWLAAAAQAPAA